ncbi:hypothetical protein Phum_PHUM065550 [Pediculus humanus corporis]|uniref:Uncharacterized protein n=1 Tax=Pediculus humanus subsp. corporis TaxID=121224 RepID=E0VBN4_PEDHC|nr:uncharacterized protein Phum_PHUM065550 [Pediculus humanus corporis]EEB10790.1 hypothetical protein Phum_PHUM065550 [Pediculus humanus corporis]
MWKENNIKDGFVIVDETELTKLIKREPIDKYYKLEQEPFAKRLEISHRCHPSSCCRLLFVVGCFCRFEL